MRIKITSILFYCCLVIFTLLIVLLYNGERADGQISDKIYGTNIDLQRRNASGIWAFKMLDMRAKNVPDMDIKSLAELLEADNPYVRGLSARFVWSLLEPTENIYDWRPIDKIIDVARAYNKTIVLRVIGSANPKTIPEWLWKKGIKYVTRRSKKGAYTHRLPIVWDPIFTQAWCNFVRELGKRYDNNPYVQRVGISIGHSGEMYYVRGNMMSDKEITKVYEYGFSRDIILGTWKKVIDTYKESFKTKPLFLNISKVIWKVKNRRDKGLEKEIVKYAVGVFGDRLYLQQNGLSQNTETIGKTISHRLMKRYAGTNVIGFQTRMPKNHGDLKRTFEKGLSYPITYIEVYTRDLKDMKNQNTIEFLARELNKKPGERIPITPMRLIIE
ncbi:MAG: beta-galactosidase [Nitrospirota bacterium]